MKALRRLAQAAVCALGALVATLAEALPLPLGLEATDMFVGRLEELSG